MSSFTSRTARAMALHAVLLPLALIWLFPLWTMFVFATLPDDGIFGSTIQLLPSTAFADNFANLQHDTDFIRAMVISIIVATVYTLLSVALTAMAGWALARYRFVGRTAVIGIIFGTISANQLLAMLKSRATMMNCGMTTTK